MTELDQAISPNPLTEAALTWVRELGYIPRKLASGKAVTEQDFFHHFQKIQ